MIELSIPLRKFVAKRRPLKRCVRLARHSNVTLVELLLALSITYGPMFCILIGAVAAALKTLGCSLMAIRPRLESADARTIS